MLQCFPVRAEACPDYAASAKNAADRVEYRVHDERAMMIRPVALLILGVTAVVPVPPSPTLAAPAIEVTPLAPGQILRGRFEQQRFLQGFQAPLKSSGTFVLSPGLGLIWKTEQPFA